MADDVTIRELDALRQFIADAFSRFDPSIDTTPGSSADVMVISPVVSRLSPDPYATDIESFVKARLLAEFPNLSVGPGEPIDDYLIKPLRVALAPYRRMINLVKLNQSFVSPETLSDEEADNLGANYFTPRKQGGYSIGVARLYYSQPQSTTITPSNPVSSAEGLQFFPTEVQSIRSDNMVFNVEGSLYYFDIIVRAASVGPSYNIEPSTLVSIEGVPNVVGVTNRVTFTGGGSTEDTTAYISRLEQSLTEKSLVTVRGIVARLSDVFAVKAVQVIGYGDLEMNRDIVKGSGEPSVYAYLRASVVSGHQDEVAVSAVNDGNPFHLTLQDIGVEVGDTVSFNDFDNTEIYEAEVVEVRVNPHILRVTPNLPIYSLSDRYTISRSSGILTISDIPGGVIDPDSPSGPIEIRDGEVHIGGQVDVYVRGEKPQTRSINLLSMRDAEPIRFGLDLESFGEASDRWIYITDDIPSLVQGVTTDRDGGAVTDHLLIRIRNGLYTPWEPSTEDIGRYLQLLGPTLAVGAYEILEVLGEELVGGVWVMRIRISLSNVDTGGTLTISNTGSPDQTGRIREKDSPRYLVRSRDNSRPPAGVDFGALGVVVGDSVVLETGDDAGIYSVRRILSSLDSDDTLLLDRALTKTVRPSGLGDYSGLRYRINDVLDVDLVQPRVTKIPLGALFFGSDLYTVAGSSVVSVGTNTNFLLAGAQPNDTLEILSGDNVGKYQVKSVTAYTATLTTPMKSTSLGIGFQLYTEFEGVARPLVRIKDIELLDSSNQPTGIKIPYGGAVDIRIKGDLSNRAEGKSVESYGGNIPTFATNRLYDDDFDFVAKGVLLEDRLTIYTSSNAGDYTIKDMGDTAGSAPYWVEVFGAADGGRDFRVDAVGIHYQTGVASAGIARFFFVEPTSLEILTGLAGGRIQAGEGGAARDFRFSAVEGRVLLPATGSEDETYRDLRVVRSFQDGGQDYSILEMTDTANPDAFDLELTEGDVFEIFEQIPFRNTGGTDFETLGLFGKAAGLQTLSGSNRITVPSNSLIDFTQMGLLTGQFLYIEDGPDTGRYRIEEVVNAKTLRIDKALTSTTVAILGLDATGSRDADLTVGPGVGESTLTDLTDPGGLGTQIGHYITIFESKDGRIEGSHEIKSVPPSPPYNYVVLDFAAVAGVTAPDSFSWIQTSGNENVLRDFHLYRSIPLQVVVTEVATSEPSPAPGVRDGNITSSTALYDPDGVVGISNGDRLEILSGDAEGTYVIQSVVGNVLNIYSTTPFPITGNDIPYRVRGGIHGPRRMVTVGSWEGGSGIVFPGILMPYRITRPRVYRLSSTGMRDQFDGSLYYADLQIESDGAGDALNLPKDTLLKALSGIEVEGYQYHVVNNNLTFSAYERVSLQFQRRFLPVGNSDNPDNMVEISGRNLQVSYETSTLASLVNDMLRSDAERTVTASSIARHMLPGYLFMTLTYRGGEDQSTVGAAVEEYINGLPATEELEISDIEAIATRRGANSIQHPLLVVVLVHDIDRQLIADRSEDKVGGLVVPYNGTARITTYFATLGEGLNVVRES